MSDTSYPSVVKATFKLCEIKDGLSGTFTTVDIDIEADDRHADRVSLVPGGSADTVKLNLAPLFPKLAKVNEDCNIDGVIDDLILFITSNAKDFEEDFSQEGYSRAAVKLLEAVREVVGVL